MKIKVKYRRKNCIVCERELPKVTRRGRKRKRIITCSPNCSKHYVRIRTYVINPYIYRIRKLKEELKNE